MPEERVQLSSGHDAYSARSSTLSNQYRGINLADFFTSFQARIKNRNGTRICLLFGRNVSGLVFIDAIACSTVKSKVTRTTVPDFWPPAQESPSVGRWNPLHAARHVAAHVGHDLGGRNSQVCPRVRHLKTRWESLSEAI